MNFDTLEKAFERVIADNKKEELDWAVRMNTRTYNRRKKYLADFYTRKVQYYRQFC